MTDAAIRKAGPTPIRSGLGELLSEADVLALWPCLSRDSLLAARKARRIAWVRGKRRAPWYRPAAVRAFIDSLEQCPVPDETRCSSLAGNGSPASREEPASTASGLTEELIDLAARASAQTILNAPRSGLRKSSSATVRPLHPRRSQSS